MYIVWRVSTAVTGVQGASASCVRFVFLSATLLASVVMPPFHEPWLSLCLVHLLFGVAGPGCGMTRAFLFLGHGDPWSALELNPNSPLVFALVLIFWANGGLRLLCGREFTVILSRRGTWASISPQRP